MFKKLAILIAFYITGLNAVADDSDHIASIYHKQCATCHGNAGDGQGRAGASLQPVPTNFSSEESKSRLTLKKIKSAIQLGVPGTAMVAYSRRFDEQTLDKLSHFIRQQFMDDKSIKVTRLNDEAGKAIYTKHCSACHGDNGNTAVWARNALNPAPRNFTAEQAKDELSLERMLTSVTYGRPGTAMMSFEKRLSKDEIKSVVHYIRTNFMKLGEVGSIPHSAAQNSTARSNMVDMNLPFPKGLLGNKDAGERFFQQNCFTCHGKKGDGKGPRAHFNFPKPRDFTSNESRKILNRPRLFKAISHGKSRSVMPAWATVITEQQIADIAEYVFQQFVVIEVKKKI